MPWHILSGMAKPYDILEEIKRLEREAFQRGWNEAVAKIMEAARQAAKQNSAPTASEAQPVERRAAGLGSMPTSYEVPVIDVILGVITDRPGLRGAEVFREAVKRVPGSDFKRMDRTGRTALARLKDRGRIFQRGKKWYPKKETESEAPAVGSPAP